MFMFELSRSSVDIHLGFAILLAIPVPFPTLQEVITKQLSVFTMKFIAALFLLVNSAVAFSPNVRPAFSKPSSTELFEYGASSTSFYTTAEKKESYESLEAVLDNKMKDPKVRAVIKDMLDVCAEITEALRTALVTVEGSMNDFGDAQLSVDVSSSGIRFCG